MTTNDAADVRKFACEANKIMKVTVAICTWNRCKLLDQTLQAMQQLLVPDGVEWELLVVNNNCTDQTDAVIARYQQKLPIRRLHETKQGLSNARNCAVAAAEGEVILWADDDVLVPPGWLRAYVEAVQAHPDGAFFGGPIEPWFEGEPPRWLVDCWEHVAAYYSMREFPEPAAHIRPEYPPFGANYAVRTQIQRNYPYDPNLGYNGGMLIDGEETAVLRAMMADGLVGWSVPQASLQHWVPKERQTLSYLSKRIQGYFQRRARGYHPSEERTLLGRPRWLWRRALEASMKYRVRRLLSQPKVWIGDLIQATHYWTMIEECGKRRERAAC